jgi:hypothetical protein
MDLTNWVIMLAVALISLAFFCARTPANWSIENRARRFTGTRLLAQAVMSLWAAVLVVVHGLLKLDGPFHLSPIVILGCALLLVIAGCYWSVRGRRLLRPRRLFAPT